MKIVVEAEISLASLAGEVASAICAEAGGVKIIFIKLQINPSVTTQGRDSSPKGAPKSPQGKMKSIGC